MAARPGSITLVDAILQATKSMEAEQRLPSALKSRGGSRSGHNFGDQVRQADQTAQNTAFGIADFIGHEGKRLIDGRFGFDALSQALPQLAQSGPENLAEALATTRQGGAQWTNQDLQAQRDRDNLGKAAGGAMDATWLLPAVGLLKGGSKAAEAADGALSAAPKLIPDDSAAARSMAGYDDWAPEWKAAFDKGLPMDTASRMARAREQGFNLDEPVFHGMPGPLEGDFIRPTNHHGVTEPKAVSTITDPRVSDSFADESGQIFPLLYRGKLGDHQEFSDEMWSMVNDAAREAGSKRIPWDGIRDAMRQKYEANGLTGTASNLGERAIFDPANLRSPSAAFDPDNIGKPTMLGMGFGFGGKDGEKPLLSALMDAMRGGKPKDAPLLPNASAPTSLDDIFTGAPKAPRPDTGPFSPQQQAYIAQNQLPDNFDLAAPTAFERMSAADEAMKKPTDLGMGTFDSPGLPPANTPRTAPPASLEDLIAQTLKRPSDIPEGDWGGILGGIQKQNQGLMDRMNSGQLFNDVEFGGAVSPTGEVPLTTQMNPYGVRVNAHELTDPAFINHSHPHIFQSPTGDAAPMSLSWPDINAVLKKDARGITSLEPKGGFGYAVGNPKAPVLGDEEWLKVINPMAEAAHPLRPGISYEARSAEGLPSSVQGMTEQETISQMAMGEALRRTNMLQQFGYRPGHSAQTETLAKYQPAINAGADAAEKSLREVLKARGFTDGQIAALIAQFGSLGTAMGALGMGTQQKAPALQPGL